MDRTNAPEREQVGSHRGSPHMIPGGMNMTETPVTSGPQTLFGLDTTPPL